MPVDFSEKVILVTGANTGIGQESARELARMGATVVMSGRNREATAAAAAGVRASTGKDRWSWQAVTSTSRRAVTTATRR